MANSETETKKKPFYKKWWFWLIVAIVLIGLIAGAGQSDKDKGTQNPEVGTQTTINNTQNSTVEQDSIATENDKELLKNAVKEKYGLVFFGNVRNDVTGNWRLAEYSASDSQEHLAIEYYKAFFEDDKEIHAVINMTNKTTARLSLIDSNTIDVTIHEYIENEEHDAKELFGGMVLGDFWVKIDTGDIEQIS